MSGRRVPAVLAVDGGASKADVALVDRTGAVLGAARRMGLSNVSVSMEGSARVIGAAVRAACVQAGIDGDGGPVASIGVYCLAGADLPLDDQRVPRALSGGGVAPRPHGP